MSDKESPTELSLYDHAAQEMAKVEEGLQALETKFKGVVYDVTTTRGMDEAKKARQEIRAPRYAVQNIAKAKKSELADISRKIGERSEVIIARIEAIENPIDKQIKAEEERKDAERAARESARQAEQQRQLNRIAGIRRVAMDLVGATVAKIDTATVVLLEDTLDDLDEVFRPDGQQARDEVIAALTVMRAQRAEADEKEAELAELRKRQDDLEAERARERASENAARAQREQEERDRIHREAAYDSAVDDIRAYATKPGTSSELSVLLVELEGIEITAERFGNRAPVAEQAQRTGILVLQDRIETARENEATAVKLADAQRQLDEQAAEQRRQAKAAQAAEEERRQAEELEAAQRALQAQEQAIREATAQEAMTEALALLEREGYSDTVEARKLRSALEKLA